MSEKLALIGVDAGGTKTAGLVASVEGKVIDAIVAGPGNYQAVGYTLAKDTLAEVVDYLVKAARKAGLRPIAVGYGLSGLDRPKDLERLERMTLEVAKDIGEEDLALNKVLVNDTYLILRAGTEDGVGVAVVSGTGANTVGRSRDGREARIGGLASELGDTGGGIDIAVAGLRAARRGKDGRGPKTIIEDLVVRHLGLSEIEDIVDFMIPDGQKVPFAAIVSSLAPLVFEAASMGDEVARHILIEMGKELGLCVRLVAEKLFSPEDAFPLVFGGSVLVGACDPLFARTIEEEARKGFPFIEVRYLECPPVVGGVLLAGDLATKRGLLGPEMEDLWRSGRPAKELALGAKKRFSGLT